MTTPAIATGSRKSFIFHLFIIGCLFFIFGFATWANSQLIPYFRISCELTRTQSYYVATAFFAAYFVMALPSSYILNKIGFKKGMSFGLLVMAAGALLFIPAANARSYPTFLTALFIIGTGLAVLQTAANPYVTVLGPIESAAQRISIMGICNKLAGIIAVYIMGGIILKNADEITAQIEKLDPVAKTAKLNELAQRVVNPYLTVGIILIAFAVVIYFLNLPEVQEPEETESSYSRNKTSIFQFPHLILGAVTIFFYVGAEVISYDTFANFGESIGYKLDQAKTFASYTGYGLLAGYVLGIILIPAVINQRKALIGASILSTLLVCMALTTKGNVAVASFAALGFSQAIMWPAIWPLAIHGLGRFAKTGAALMIMGILGGAVLPPLYGKIAELIGSRQHAYFIMLPCYLFVLYYAVAGFKVGWKKN